MAIQYATRYAFDNDGTAQIDSESMRTRVVSGDLLGDKVDPFSSERELVPTPGSDPLLLSDSSFPVQRGIPRWALRINFSCPGDVYLLPMDPSYWQSRLWVSQLLYCFTVCTEALWHIYIFGLISPNRTEQRIMHLELSRFLSGARF